MCADTPTARAEAPAGERIALNAIIAYREARRDYGRTSDEASAAYARLLNVEERLRGPAYTDDDLEQEAIRIHQERYPGQSWGSDSSARVVSYKEARKRLDAAALAPAPAIPAADASRGDGPIKITISDPETGKVLEERILQNDYAIICAGNRYVKNIQVMGCTHMLAVATFRQGDRR